MNNQSSRESRTDVWLVFGNPGLGFRGMTPPLGAPVGLARLHRYICAADDLVAWLRYEDVLVDRAGRTTLEMASTDCCADLPEAIPLATGLPFDERLADEGVFDTDWMPIFLITETAMESRLSRSVLVCSRIRSGGLTFTRIWAGDVPVGEGFGATLLRAADEEPTALHRFSDESAQASNLKRDTEIELKFTLEPGVSAWRVCRRLGTALRERRLDGFMPDVGNESQRWTYEQDTFALNTSTGDSLGYVAFMRTPGNGVDVKYKLFAADGLHRKETFDDGMSIDPSDYHAWVEERFPDTIITPMPRMTRTRFDVNVLSQRTGHFYGLETDEVHAGGAVLNQLEIEYHRSQLTRWADNELIEPELFRLRDIVATLLEEWGIGYKLGYLSKLTFLRSVAEQEGSLG